MSPHITLTTIALVLLAGSQTAQAQEAVDGAPPSAAPFESVWNAQAQAGLLMTAGNSATTTLASALHVSREAGKNHFVLDIGEAFARSTTTVVRDANRDRVISESEVDRVSTTTMQFWFVKPRYDRALDSRNALYVAAVLLSDSPAGKRVVGSGQVGYSRLVVQDSVHSLRLESGYDFSYEEYSAPGSLALSIHSVRAFAGYQGKLSGETSLRMSVEGLFNLNRLAGASGSIDRLGDRRVDSKLSLTTKITANVSVGFSFQARHDSAPAARPALSLPFADGFRPLADRLDTRTEAALIINLL